MVDFFVTAEYILYSTHRAAPEWFFKTKTLLDKLQYTGYSSSLLYQPPLMPMKTGHLGGKVSEGETNYSLP